MSTNEIRWIKIADSEEDLPFGVNHIAEVMAEGKTICIAKYKNSLFAFTQKCPHAGGFLAEGYIDILGNVVCPLHRYKYCISNGRNVSGEGYYLKNWKVETRDDGIFVGFTTDKYFGFFSF